MLRRIIIEALVALGVLYSLFATIPARAQTPVIPYSAGEAGKPAVPVQWFPVLLNGLTSTVTQIKGSAGKLAYLYCYNSSGSVAYLQLFDSATAAAVTVGTTTPKMSLGIPNGQANGLGPAEIGIKFANGIQAASTTLATGSSTSATMDCNAAYN